MGQKLVEIPRTPSVSQLYSKVNRTILNKKRTTHPARNQAQELIATGSAKLQEAEQLKVQLEVL